MRHVRDMVCAIVRGKSYRPGLTFDDAELAAIRRPHSTCTAPRTKPSARPRAGIASRTPSPAESFASSTAPATCPGSTTWLASPRRSTVSLSGKDPMHVPAATNSRAEPTGLICPRGRSRAAIGQQTSKTAMQLPGAADPGNRINRATAFPPSLMSRSSKWPVTPEVAGSSPVARQRVASPRHAEEWRDAITVEGEVRLPDAQARVRSHS